MTNKSTSKDIAGDYALGFAFIAVSITIFLIPNDYKFSWSNYLAMAFLMISSVGFAFSLQKVMSNAKDSWDNLGTGLIIFYFIYGVTLFLLKFSLLNPYTTLILLFISLFAFFGLFKGITNLVLYLFQNFRTSKSNFFKALIKIVPVFLPVVSLILQVLKLI